MLQPVSVGAKSLSDYTHLVGRKLIEEVRELAEDLKGKRVLHISATAFGGGVSEILFSLVPLMRDVGLEADWQIILGREEFFNSTKQLHNSLQGNPQSLTDEEWECFFKYNEINAKELDGECDYLIIHDPQPAALHRYAPDASKHWIWRCHIDLSTPNKDDLGPVIELVNDHDISVFHLDQYKPKELRIPAKIMPPAIDPLSPKNMALAQEDASYVCDQFGIDIDRQLICQVSRFDPWKDPLGVIDAYKQVKKDLPKLQLALVGSMATDDPEGWDYFHKTYEYAQGDSDIHILNNLNNVGAIEVNAFQSQSDVILQKSIREGFGLTVTEGLWKVRPVVAGNVGGIPLQIEDGESGFLVDSPEQAAERVLEILRDPPLGKRLARAGKEHVRSHFLMPRLLRDWLLLLRDLG